MKEALVDTDILSEFLKGNLHVVSKVDGHVKKFGFINLSIITFYEIMNGLLYKDSKGKLPVFKKFVSNNKLFPITLNVARISASISADLRKNRMEIGHFDVLIAGTAIANNLQLVTNNVKHFSRIKDLQIINWKIPCE
jgi:tRNA(fMet)-specific endonuclease VapC